MTLKKVIKTIFIMAFLRPLKDSERFNPRECPKKDPKWKPKRP
jgi:hypothetical protein